MIAREFPEISRTGVLWWFDRLASDYNIHKYLPQRPEKRRETRLTERVIDFLIFSRCLRRLWGSIYTEIFATKLLGAVF